MATRRTFLKTVLGASAAGAIVRPLWGETRVAPFYKVIIDERFEEARAFAAAAVERGIPAALIQGDVTNLFYDDLDLRWKKGPVLIAGYTPPASLFCLELLARGRGMRLSHCIANPGTATALDLLDEAADSLPLPATKLPPAARRSDLVLWIIAPRQDT